MEGTGARVRRSASPWSRAAQKEMIVPASCPSAPRSWSVSSSSGGARAMLLGVIVVGIFLAIQMTTGGGPGTRQEVTSRTATTVARAAPPRRAVTGDTVGDPNKDTAGPAINPMIKVMNIVAIPAAR